LQKHIDHLESALATAEKKRADDQSNFLNTLKNLEKSLEETKEIINGLTQEKRELLRELNETKSALAKEKADHVDTQRANTLLQKKLENAEKHKEAVKSLQEQRDEYKKVINESQVYHAE
jgi:Alanyl-tRNA synthetase